MALQPIAVRRGLLVSPSDVEWRFSRSSGPGGQGVNTADSRVELRFDVARSPTLGPTHRARALERLEARLVAGVVSIVASEHRSQLRNREAAFARLVDLLREATAPPPRTRRPSRPTASAVQRRLDDKRRRSRTKALRRPQED